MVVLCWHSPGDGGGDGGGWRTGPGDGDDGGGWTWRMGP